MMTQALEKLYQENQIFDWKYTEELDETWSYPKLLKLFNASTLAW